MKGGGERPAGEVRLECLPRGVAEKRIDPVGGRPRTALGAQDQRGPGGETRRLLDRPGLDRSSRRSPSGRKLGPFEGQLEERRPLLARKAIGAAPHHGERRRELVEHLLQTRHRGEVAAGQARVALPCAPADAGPVEEGADPGRPPGRSGRAAQGIERAAQGLHGAGGAEERGPLPFGPPGTRQRRGPGAQPLLRVAAAVEDPGPVEEEAEIGNGLGGTEVGRAEEREDGGPVDLPCRRQRGPDVLHDREARERAGDLRRQGHSQTSEGSRERLQDPARREHGDVGWREPVLEQGGGEARRRVALGLVGRGRQPHHPAPCHGSRGRELDVEVAEDRELVQRLDPAQPGVHRRRPGRLLGEERHAREDAARPRRERSAEVEGRAGGGQESLQHEETEVVRLLRTGATRSGTRGGPERTRGVERVPFGEPVLVAGESGGGGGEPLGDARRRPRGRTPEVGR